MNLLLTEVMGEPIWMWGTFLALMLGLLVFDLGVIHRRPHEIGLRESLLLSALYISLGLLFSLWIWQMLGAHAAMLYLTGYVVEKSLSLDNVFLIALIFSYFAIPRAYQHKVLIWGIVGVIVLRGVMIGAGTVIVSHFEWVLYVFAVFLIFTGVKMLLNGDHQFEVADNPVLRLLRRWLPLSSGLHGHRFFIRSGSRLLATPLLLTLFMVETADLIFAIDSIPAIFSITTDPYIAYTSNIFAVLGLRALYFVFVVLIARFTYLKYALSLVLVFIGSKTFLAELFPLEKFPSALSLVITVLLITGGIFLSLFSRRPPECSPMSATNPRPTRPSK